MINTNLLSPLVATAPPTPQTETAQTETTQTATIDVTVAIPTYNGAERLPAVLDGLRSQVNIQNLRWEVIICDNCSTDNTAAVVRRYQANWPQQAPLQYRFAAEQGAAFARQYAVELAKGELVAFLDDDNIPTNTWLSEAYQFAQTHPKAGVFGSQIHGKFESELPEELAQLKCFLAIIERGDQPHLYEPAKKILPPAAGLVVRRQAWLDAVPKRLFLNNKGKSAGLASEDLEAILHIQKSGQEVWYNPRMVVHHDIPDGRLRQDYLVTLLRCVGLSRYYVRILGTESWKRPLVLPAYIANDIRKLAFHRLRLGAKSQLNTVERCHRELLTSTARSPLFLLRKAYKDTVQDRTDSQHIDRKRWLAEITYAFEHNQFSLYQQPVIAIDRPDSLPFARNEPNQNELLLRLNNRQNECILPKSFLPTAKRYGLMRTIDRWVIRTLFEKVAQAKNQPAFAQAIAQLNSNPLYSINLSTDSVKDSGLGALIAQKVSSVGLPASLFCFEISAATALEAPNETGELMETLRRVGCKITLDNVTVGRADALYDSVNDLVSYLPLDFIKLRTNAMALPGGRTEWTRLQKRLQQRAVKAIAQGVESQAGLDALQAQGIRYAQGYQIGRPYPLLPKPPQTSPTVLRSI